MLLDAPWTQIGALQQEMSNMKGELSRKAESCEIHSINCRLDNLEHSLREIIASLDGYLCRLQACEDKVNADT